MTGYKINPLIKAVSGALALAVVLKVVFTYQRCFRAVNFLPDQNTKVRPRQEATEDIANFIV